MFSPLCIFYLSITFSRTFVCLLVLSFNILVCSIVGLFSYSVIGLFQYTLHILSPIHRILTIPYHTLPYYIIPYHIISYIHIIRIKYRIFKYRSIYNCNSYSHVFVFHNHITSYTLYH